jgi:hypothetical protein
MRAMSRAAVFVATAVLLGSGTAYGAELPRGPVTATTVASAQAEATTAGTTATDAARAAAESGVALDAAKAAAAAAATKAAQTNDPADIAAAAAASAAQATAQQNFDAKTAASATAAAAKTAAEANASREAASFAKLSNGTYNESSASLPDDTALPPVDKTANVEYVGHSTGPSQTYFPPFTTNPPVKAELDAYNANLAKKTCPAYSPSKCPGFSALNFIHYENLGYDFMVANGTPGMSIWSLKDPAHPKYIAGINAATIGAKTGENLNQFWEGENMTVDSRRKLAFMSKDSGKKGIVTVDVKDPWNPQIVSFQPTWLGHTATCLNDCRFIWQVGGSLPSSFGARKSAVAVTDIRDPEHPFTYANVFEAAVRRTNVTGGSTHSVDVDFDGVAWVSGSGGTRGWWTEGLHKDTVTGQMRYATPYDPLPYGGGPIAGAGANYTFMHNAYHVPQALGTQAAGDTMLITNEVNDTNCATAGLFYVASLKGTRDVENNLPGAPVVSPAVPAQMELLSSYSTNGKPGQFHGTATSINTRTGVASQATVGDCSAHWFTVKGDIVALGNYEQGTRFVDISDPRNPKQVGYFRVPASGTINTPGEVIASEVAGAYWHGDYVYVSDYSRGIDVLKFKEPKGDTQSKTCWNSCADNQTMTGPNDEQGGVGGSVGATLSLSLGTPAAFTPFTPGVANDYQSQTNATVISTAGDGTLSVADPSPSNTGHLVNGAFALPSALKAKATSAAGTGAAFADVGGSANPTPVLTYSGPTSNDTVTLAFQQHIGAADALRTGAYSKTLTFTLSTTTP